MARFDSINIAQQRYQELHGDILPVKSFVVPDKTSLYDSDAGTIRIPAAVP